MKPEKSRHVQTLILQMAQSGQIRQQLTETDLIELLSRLQEDETPRVTIHRRRESDDEEEYTFK